MSELKYWLWLSSCTGVSANAKQALLDAFSDPRAAFEAASGSFSRIRGISKKEAAALEEKDLGRVEEILRSCEKSDIRVICLRDEDYPRRLRNIYAPPVALYISGNLPDIDTSPLISVIGTRRASEYGLKMGYSMAYEISRCGGTVVSLLTAGIDEEAAFGAMQAGGPLVAVLGTSLDKLSPSLLRQITAIGAVVSEYPPKTVPQRSFFRDRNRIAAGLSVGVVVIEAPEKSGTRLFVREAAEQGKDIFALPGNADSESSVGTLEMLKEGACLVTHGWELMEEYKDLFPDKVHILRDIEQTPREPRSNSRRKKLGSGRKKTSEIKSGSQKPGSQPSGPVPAALPENLSENQRAIISALHEGADTVDELIFRTSLPAPLVLSQLTVLEIKGLVKREAGSRFHPLV